MKAVSINDDKQYGNTRTLAFDIINLLNISKGKIKESKWRLDFVDCIGDSFDEINKIVEIKNEISGDRLLQLASGIDQTIDGDFWGRLPESTNPWICIRAIDGMEFVIITGDEEYLSGINRTFSSVKDSYLDIKYMT